MRAFGPPVPHVRRGPFPARGGGPAPLSSCATEEEAPRFIAVLRLRNRLRNGRPGTVSRETVCGMPTKEDLRPLRPKE